MAPFAVPVLKFVGTISLGLLTVSTPTNISLALPRPPSIHITVCISSVPSN